MNEDWGKLEKIDKKNNFGMRNACRKYSIEYFRSATAAGAEAYAKAPGSV
jgi:hypothetical protein